MVFAPLQLMTILSAFQNSAVVTSDIFPECHTSNNTFPCRTIWDKPVALLCSETLCLHSWLNVLFLWNYCVLPKNFPLFTVWYRVAMQGHTKGCTDSKPSSELGMKCRLPAATNIKLPCVFCVKAWGTCVFILCLLQKCVGRKVSLRFGKYITNQPPTNVTVKQLWVIKQCFLLSIYYYSIPGKYYYWSLISSAGAPHNTPCKQLSGPKMLQQF